MNDTLRHVHTDLSTTGTQHFDSSKKRSRSAESDEESHCPNQPPPQTQATSRPTRPLKFSKSRLSRAPSLPSGLLSDPHVTETEEVVEEEDWSQNMSSEIAEQLEVMEF